MCDYSLMHLKSRDAEKNEKLITRSFGTSRGFAGTDPDVAVCVRPGTILAFDAPVKVYDNQTRTLGQVAWFLQVNKEIPHVHHDAIKFDTGEVILVNQLYPDQLATVMLLPEAPKTKEEAEDQARVPICA